MGALALPKSKAVNVTLSLNNYTGEGWSLS